MELRLTLVTYIFLQLSLSGFAQKDTVLIDSVRADSSMQSATEFQALIKESNELKLIDSLHRSELENQVSLLRESNSLRKSKLELELKVLADKDSLRKIRAEHTIDTLKRTAMGYP